MKRGNIFKAAVITALSFVMVISMTSCGEETQTLTDEDGNILKYMASEITEDGFYVHDKKADIFYPVMSGFNDSYPGLPNVSAGDLVEELTQDRQDGTRSIWMSNTTIDPMKLIPVVDGKRTELVYFQDSENDMPENYVLEKYKKLGYSIGAKVTFGDTGDNLYIDPKSLCVNSSAESIFKPFASGDNLLRISRINKSKDLPIKNVDTDTSILVGLDKGKKYQIGFFDGTQYNDVDVLADALCFKSDTIIDLKSPFKTTEDDYFIVNLPKNMKKGYYFINENGMFGYRPKDNSKKYIEQTTVPTQPETTKSTENSSEDVTTTNETQNEDSAGVTPLATEGGE